MRAPQRFRTLIAFALYYAGHVVSLPISWWGWVWPHPLYSWLMVKSFQMDTHGVVWEIEGGDSNGAGH